MNVEYINESFNAISHEIAHCLCPSKIALIKHSLIILQTESKLKNIYFWGRLNGIENDYYIAFGYTKSLLSDRSYFYSKDCFEWYLLPMDALKESDYDISLMSASSLRESDLSSSANSQIVSKMQKLSS